MNISTLAYPEPTEANTSEFLSVFYQDKRPFGRKISKEGKVDDSSYEIVLLRNNEIQGILLPEGKHGFEAFDLIPIIDAVTPHESKLYYVYTGLNYAFYKNRKGTLESKKFITSLDADIFLRKLEDGYTPIAILDEDRYLRLHGLYDKPYSPLEITMIVLSKFFNK